MHIWTSGEIGQGLVEYAMILVLVVIAVMATLMALGVSVQDVLYVPIVDAFTSLFS
jgi:Flp pilus assembly pilin Flp